MSWFDDQKHGKSTSRLYSRLLDERVVWDTSRPEDVEFLRRDVRRIAEDMDDPSKPPPMFWTGIPQPASPEDPSCGYQLVVSIGGTKTDFALLRLERGEVLGLDMISGREVRGPAEIDRVKTATQMATPKYGPRTPSGQKMVEQIVEHIAPHVRRQREAFERCEAIFLAWGFPHSVIRTGEKLAGGLTARVTRMTKEQAEFTDSLQGKEIGLLLEGELRAQVGWRRPIAVANDTVMALHYFLAPERSGDYSRVGLLIVGTGTNFSAAETYAVGPEGFISKPGRDRAPERITPSRPLAPGEEERSFFVNYEAGSLDLVATRTRFDTRRDYPLEQNALAGGNAFSQQLRAYVEEFVSRTVYERLRRNWSRAVGEDGAIPAGPAVSILAESVGTRSSEHEQLLDGIEGSRGVADQLRLIARAIVARSALHAGLVLAAVTRRTGFGTGLHGKRDLLGMEGSVWKTPGYPELVRGYWQELVSQEPLAVELTAEPSFNASLSGPLYLAALHR